MHFQQVLLAVAGLVVLRVIYSVYQSLTSPLRSVPGPLLARFTRLWYFKHVWDGQFELENIELHNKYGSIVRVQPDHYVINDPDAVKTIYAIGSKFPKSDWYYGWKHPSSKHVAVFTDQNIKRHAELRKRFQGLYSMSSLVTYEEYVNQCADIFDSRLREGAGRGRFMNMGHWFQCYAFDVIGNITFSKRFGFLDQGEDIGNVMAALHKSMSYSTLIGIFPRLHPILFHIVGLIPNSGASGRLYLMNFTQSRISQRKKERAALDAGEIKSLPTDLENSESNAPQDFLEKLMRASDKDPEKVTPYHQFMMAFSNVVAGSDTTAGSLSAILYELIRNPSCMEKLRSEITDFRSQGRCGDPIIAFKESQEMPYLQAVMKEALRLHPVVGLPLWRVVPEGGAEISGRFFPQGTVVGINAWAAHYNKDVWGQDAAVFRPERWIEAEAAAKEGTSRLKEMEGYYLPFGLGSRTCLGRHISFLEMSKLIPRLVTTFDFELVRPNEDWKTTNYWFITTSNFEVRVKVR